MEILQKPITEDHESAMFFNGIVATGEKGGKKYTLKTFQDGELGYRNKLYVGGEIRELAKLGVIDDADVDEEDIVDIFVDKFFVITEEGEEVDVDSYDDNLYFNDYEQAIEGFENFLNQ